MNPRIWKWINWIFSSGIWVQPFAMAALIWFFKNVLQGDVSYDVNVSEVRPEELLSFKVFRYDGRKLTVARDEVLDVLEAKEKVKRVIR